MGNITKKQIKKLVKAAKEEMADAIEQEAIRQIESGNPVDFNVEVQMGDGDPPSEKLGAVTECRWICITIFGVRFCWWYCE